MKTISFCSLLLLSGFLLPAEKLNQRFKAPAGYKTLTSSAGSFEDFLSTLPLKEKGSHAYTYRSELAHTDEYTAAVVDFQLGRKDLQQCADAVIRLRAEYFWKLKQYDKISFNFTSGFRCQYTKYAEGYRYADGRWVKKKEKDYSYRNFREYLDLVFTYAGTLSLEKELIKASRIQVGNVFIKGGSPGHCFIIVNCCVQNSDTLFQLAQSYMPAQDIQILKTDAGPWFKIGTIADMPYSELMDRKYMRKFE